MFRLHGPLRVLLVTASVSLLAACSSPAEKVATFNAKGHALLLQGDLVKARLEFQNAIQINPNAVEPMLGLAEIAERNREWARAYVILNKAVDLDARQVTARVKLAKLMLASGQMDRALQLSDAALQLDPGSADVLAVRSAVFLKMQDFKVAVELANKALALDPRHLDAFVVLASERLQAGDAGGAVAFLDKGLAGNERNVAVHLLKVQALERLSRFDKAEEVLQHVVALHPEDVRYRYMLAKFYLAHGDVGKAEVQYRQVVTATPKALEPKLELVRFLRATKGLDGAAAEVERMLATEPSGHDLRLALAQVRILQNKDSEALALWRQVVADAPDAPVGLRARSELATHFIAQGDRESAKPLIAEILAKDARNEDALVLRASVAIDERRLDDAVAALRTVLRDVPDSARAQLLLGRTHELQGLVDLAQTHYARAAQAGRFVPQYTMPYATYLVKLGRLNSAEGALREVLRAAPGHIPAYRMLAQVHLRQGNLVEAEAVADELNRSEKDAVAASLIRGAVQAARREFDGSMASFKRAYDLAPGELQPLVAVVRSYLAAGKTRDAVAFLQSAVQASPKNTSALLLQGQLLSQTGDPKGGARSYEAALKVDPKLLPAYHGLAMVNAVQKNIPAAFEWVDRGLKVVPNDFGLRLTRAGLLESEGRNEEAIQTYEALLVERPQAAVVANNLASLLADHRSDQASYQRAYDLAQRFRGTDVPHFRDTLGWAAHRVGKPEEASELLSTAAKEMPGMPSIQYHHGMNQLALNNRQVAREALERAVELARNTPFSQLEDARRALQAL